MWPFNVIFYRKAIDQAYENDAVIIPNVDDRMAHEIVLDKFNRSIEFYEAQLLDAKARRKQAESDVQEYDAILNSMRKAVVTLVDQVMERGLLITDNSADKTDPSMPMGENGNSRID